MSEDDSSILIKEDQNEKEEMTVDSILGTKVLITTVSTISLVIYFSAIIILLIFDVWLALFIMKLVGYVSFKLILINIPLIILSFFIFIRVAFANGLLGRILSLMICTIIVVMIPLFSLRLDMILKGDVLYYFIAIFVAEALNLMLRVQTYYFKYDDIKKHNETFGYSWSLACSIICDLLRIGSEIFILLALTEKTPFYDNYLWCGLLFIFSLIFFFASYVFLKGSTTYTGLMVNGLRALFIVFAIAQTLLIVLNIGKNYISTTMIASVPTLAYVAIVHVCFIVAPILYFLVFKKIVKHHLDDSNKTPFLHEN